MVAIGVPGPHGEKDWYRLRAAPIVEEVELQACREYGLAGSGLAQINEALSGKCEELVGYVGDRAVKGTLVLSTGGGAEDVVRAIP
ncbi:hypothetical protein [Streptomyces sp. NPDC005181]|uniref:hypothetical protein n=1 Tax=Streptomyces sp. NPDC005181 TaxID=3156869 RepID=UPI0033BD7A23